MKNLPLLFLLLHSLALQSQTEIQELSYQSEYRFCLGVSCTVSLPILKVSEENDIRKKVNDSIVAIYRETVDVWEPTVEDYAECWVNTDSPDYIDLSYSVNANNDSLLSFVVLNHITPGNGGHGSLTNPICFNVDLLRNELMLPDSVFKPGYEEHIVKFAEQQTDSLLSPGRFRELYPDYAFFLGINIGLQNITAYYNVYLGSSIYELLPVQIPMIDMSGYLREKYRWLSRE